MTIEQTREIDWTQIAAYQGFLENSVTPPENRQTLYAIMTEEEKAHWGISTLHVQDHTGDSRIMWDPSRPDEVDVARASFDAAKEKGMLAYSVDANDVNKRGEVVREFDATAGKLILVPQTVGG